MTKENRLEGIHTHNPLVFYEEVVKCLLLALCAISQTQGHSSWILSPAS